MATILLSGGAGYIASHTAVILIERGHDVILLDNFSNAERDVPDRLHYLTGQHLPVIEADLRDREAVARAFNTCPIDLVVHFAALKSVSESETNPLKYFNTNIIGTIHLLDEMQRANVKRIVFSSSATVYGIPETLPITEGAALRPTNVYGRTKSVMEDLITELQRTNILASTLILRYFNPVGAHASALIGEVPIGIPNNLMPYLCQVAARERPALQVFGSDYATHDGTGVRDYIHVVDLAEAHAQAVEFSLRNEGTLTLNLGTGRGTSVLDLVGAFERVTGHSINLKFTSRRPGDVASCYADPSLANTLLGWHAKRGIDDMCRDAWAWYSSRVSIRQVETLYATAG
jgi:UDP-glucose 4-epimerase